MLFVSNTSVSKLTLPTIRPSSFNLKPCGNLLAPKLAVPDPLPTPVAVKIVPTVLLALPILIKSVVPAVTIV